MSVAVKKVTRFASNKSIQTLSLNNHNIGSMNGVTGEIERRLAADRIY